MTLVGECDHAAMNAPDGIAKIRAHEVIFGRTVLQFRSSIVRS
jgi:hypothetical protein